MLRSQNVIALELTPYFHGRMMRACPTPPHQENDDRSETLLVRRRVTPTAVNKSSKQPVLAFHFTLPVMLVVSTALRSRFISTRTCGSPLISLAAKCEEYHKMMRTSQEVSRGSILNPIFIYNPAEQRGSAGLSCLKKAPFDNLL